jgi:hypothetical protein
MQDIVPHVSISVRISARQVLSIALDAVHRFSSFGASPSVLRRLNSTAGCIGALVRV